MKIRFVYFKEDEFDGLRDKSYDRLYARSYARSHNYKSRNQGVTLIQYTSIYGAKLIEYLFRLLLKAQLLECQGTEMSIYNIHMTFFIYAKHFFLINLA